MGKQKECKKKCCAKFRKKGKPCSRCPLFAKGCALRKLNGAPAEKKDKEKKDKKKKKKDAKGKKKKK